MKQKLIDSDASRLDLIMSAKESFRDAQRTRTWEERVAAIARMNIATRLVRGTNKREQAQQKTNE
jgi:hypothetical protein